MLCTRISLLAAGVLAAPAAAQVFSAPATVFDDPAATTGPFLAAACVDLDGNGSPDLVGTLGASLRVLLANGSGGYVAASAIATGTLNFGAKASDLDRDGSPDLVVWGLLDGIAVLLGDGLGGFSAPAAVVGSSSTEVEIVDVNGDGLPDLVQGAGTALAVRLGNGDGTFQAPLLSAVPGLGIGDLALGDFTGDGIQDVVAATFFGDCVLLQGSGTGSFAPFGSVPGFATHPLLCDIDGDGDLDLLRLDRIAGAIELRRNDGSGAFGPPDLVAPVIGNFLTVDVDGDGAVDLLATDGTSLRVWPGDGSGAFGPEQATAVEGQLLASGDLDGDGRIDLLTGPLLATRLQVVRNALGVPDGTAAYGTGTPSCTGTLGITASARAAVGESNFRIISSNVPRVRLGWIHFGLQDLAGSDPFGIGLRHHVQVLGVSTTALLFGDCGGVASYPLPIPANAALAGLDLHAQTIWLADAGAGDNCSPSTLYLVSSRGLRIIVQP